MQNLNQIEFGLVARLPVERLVPAAGPVLFVSVSLIILGFIPMMPPGDALTSGGLTMRGGIEFGMILTGLLVIAVYAKSKDAIRFDLRNPSFLLVSVFVFWAVLSSLWSPNPALTIAKSLELLAITIAAAIFVAVAARLFGDRGRIETMLVYALLAALGSAILLNVVLWGSPLPTTANDSLPLELLGEESPVLRPRLILAYAHPLLTADILALTIISLFTAPVRKLLKTIAIPILLLFLWLADARGPSIALMLALAAVIFVWLKRNTVRATVLTLVASTCLALTLFFQDLLLKPFGFFLTDDVYTLNSRTELWTKALGYIAQQPIVGNGYYSARYLLMRDFTWAGHAHNSYIEILLTTGLIGLIVLGIYLASLVKTLITSGNALLLGAFVYILIQGMLNPLLFTPGVPMFVLTIAALSAGVKNAAASPQKGGQGLNV